MESQQTENPVNISENTIPNLNDVLIRQSDEDDQTFELRKRYTENAFYIVQPAISSQAALMAGFMMTMKIKYNLKYDPYTEKTLRYINDQIRKTL